MAKQNIKIGAICTNVSMTVSEILLATFWIFSSFSKSSPAVSSVLSTKVAHSSSNNMRSRLNSNNRKKITEIAEVLAKSQPLSLIKRSLSSSSFIMRKVVTFSKNRFETRMII